MLIRMLCAPALLTKAAVKGAFALGAVAGTAGVLGALVLRRVVEARRGPPPAAG